MLDVFKKDLARMKAQEKEQLATVHATQGVIQYLEHLVNELEGDSIPIDQFAEMIGGPGAKATIDESK